MTNKDRRIQFSLQLFYLIVGIYTILLNFGTIYSDRFPTDIFDYHSNDIPAFSLAAGFLSGLAALISSLSLWTRRAWAYGFALFSSGLLFCYNLQEMGSAIYRNPYETIPMVIILIVVLQSFPFLLKKTDRFIA